MNVIKLVEGPKTKTIKAWELDKGQIGVIENSHGYGGVLVIRTNKSIVALANGDTWTLEKDNNIPSFDIEPVKPGTIVEIHI